MDIVSSTKPQITTTTIAYITLEYCLEDLFSGNGICARSQVRGLSNTTSNSNFRQHVIAARPSSATNPPHTEDTPPGVQLHIVPVPTWRTTERTSDHEAFAKGVAHILESLEEPLTAILAVDWTGVAGIQALEPSFQQRLLARTPVFFLNFRVYSRMTNISTCDRDFYLQREREAVCMALESGGGIMGLCNSDTAALKALALTSALSGIVKEINHAAFRTILPMLRTEFATIAARDKDVILDTTARRRRYFVCLVRFSEDKGPQRFVDVCADITNLDQDFWTRMGVIPLMVGAASQATFATNLKQRFRDHVPGGVVMEDFLNSQQLVKILKDALLNMHPAIYEAYGMTIVEAGACGVPTLLNWKGIGAEQLLSAPKGASISIEMEDRAKVVTKVMALLQDPEYLASVGKEAYKAATSWNEESHVAALWDLVETRMTMIETQDDPQ